MMFGPSLRGNARYIRVFVCRHFCMYAYMLFLTQLVSVHSLAVYSVHVRKPMYKREVCTRFGVAKSHVSHPY